MALFSYNLTTETGHLDISLLKMCFSIGAFTNVHLCPLSIQVLRHQFRGGDGGSKAGMILMTQGGGGGGLKLLKT